MRLMTVCFLASFLLGSVSGARTESESCCEDLISRLKAAERTGKIGEARRYASRLIERARAGDPNGPLLAAALEHSASLAEDQAHLDEAEHLYEESIALWERQAKAHPLELANSLNGLGSIYNSTGKLDQAEALCRRALTLRLDNLGANSVDVAISYSNLGVTLLRQHKWIEADATARQALTIWSRLHSVQDRSAVDLNTLALLRLQQRNYQAAIKLDEMAISKCKESPPPDQWSLISYLHTLAVICWTAGQASASLAAFEDAVCALQASSFPNLLEKSNLLSDYASVLRKTGQRRSARAIDRQAKAARAEILKSNLTERYVVDFRSLLPRP